MSTSSRDLFNHSAGKGDKPRTKLDENYRKRYDAINWGRKSKKKNLTNPDPGATVGHGR